MAQGEGFWKMISFASDKHKSGIIALWQEAFGDSEEVILDYMGGLYTPGNTVVYTDNEKVVAMAFMLSISCEEKKGRYIYAVATAKSHRGKGLCKEVMTFVEKTARVRGESFLILVPASSSLFDFYKKMGYNHTVFAPDYTEFTKTDKILTASEYYDIRRDTFSEADLIGWDKKTLDYILSHGKAVKTTDGAVYCENGKVVEVLSKGLAEQKWESPFAQIKYLEDFKFNRPYFGLAMN